MNSVLNFMAAKQSQRLQPTPLNSEVLICTWTLHSRIELRPCPFRCFEYVVYYLQLELLIRTLETSFLVKKPNL